MQLERTAIQISHLNEPAGRQDVLRLGLQAWPLMACSSERLQNQRVCIRSCMFAWLLRTLLSLIWFSELHNRMSQHQGYTLIQFIQLFWLWFLNFYFLNISILIRGQQSNTSTVMFKWCGRQKTASTEYKRRTTAACGPFCRSVLWK